MISILPSSGREWGLWSRLGLLATTLLPLYYLSYILHPSYGGSGKSSKIQTPLPLRLSHPDFQKQWLDTHLLEPFNPYAIQVYCKDTKWRPNLVFNLPNANGGIGNVRAEVLDFVYYAIEAGASIILPGMAKRSEEVLFDVWGAGRTEFSAMFDEVWFKASLQVACPQMKILDPPMDGNFSLLGTKVDQVYFPMVPKARRDVDTKMDWVLQTNKWLEEHHVGDEETVISIVDVERTMWQVDTRNTPPGFRVNFPMTLRINPDIRRYAAAVMSNMDAKYNLHMNPRDQLHERAFCGAHLRTESDTIAAGWQSVCSERECGMNWTTQTDAYISHALENNLDLIYTASGNASEIERFRQKAAAHMPHLTVVDKWDLLSASDVQAVASLHWDQQALIDLEILLRCSVFGGMAKSSYAFTIAMARNAWMEQKGFVMDSWFASHLDAVVAFADEKNRIWGRNQLNEEKIPRGAWP